LDESGDTYQDSTSTAIQCRLYTKKYHFQLPLDLKKLEYVELWIKDLIGEADISAYWRADGYTLWNKCNTVHVSADEAGLKQHRRRLRFTPLERKYDASGKDVRTGGMFQFCIAWGGSLTIERARFVSRLIPQENRMVCDDESPVELLEESGQYILDDYEYEVT